MAQPLQLARDAGHFLDWEIRKHLGAPLVTPVFEDLTEFKEKACYRFYLARPTAIQHEIAVSRGTNDVSIPEMLLADCGNDADRASQYYFLGLLFHNFARTGEDMPIGLPFGNLFTLVPQHPLTLRGTLRGYGPFYGGLSLFKPLDVTPLALRATETDILDSEEYFLQIDEENQKIHMVSPDAGKITMVTGYGFMGNRDRTPPTYPWDKIPKNQLRLVASLAVEEALETMVSANSLVKVSGSDYEVDVSYLQSKLEALKEQNVKDLRNSWFPVHMLG